MTRTSTARIISPPAALQRILGSRQKSSNHATPEVAKSLHSLFHEDRKQEVLFFVKEGAWGELAQAIKQLQGNKITEEATRFYGGQSLHLAAGIVCCNPAKLNTRHTSLNWEIHARWDQESAWIATPEKVIIIPARHHSLLIGGLQAASVYALLTSAVEPPAEELEQLAGRMQLMAMRASLSRTQRTY